MLIQILDRGKVPWIENEVHNYARLLHTAVPTYLAMLAAKADLAALCAYSTRYVPPDALEELTAYLLSWAASTSPFQLLTAKQLREAAASDNGAVGAAELLLQVPYQRQRPRCPA